LKAMKIHCVIVSRMCDYMVCVRFHVSIKKQERVNKQMWESLQNDKVNYNNKHIAM
jgi:hypothetical protein